MSSGVYCTFDDEDGEEVGHARGGSVDDEDGEEMLPGNHLPHLTIAQWLTWG